MTVAFHSRQNNMKTTNEKFCQWYSLINILEIFQNIIYQIKSLFNFYRDSRTESTCHGRVQQAWTVSWLAPKRHVSVSTATNSIKPTSKSFQKADQSCFLARSLAARAARLSTCLRTVLNRFDVAASTPPRSIKVSSRSAAQKVSVTFW